LASEGAGQSTKEASSLGERAYGVLRRDIVQGNLLPGSRIPLTERAKREGVSLSVIREAASRLASEGLLSAAPQRGFWVPELSVDDLEDLTWTRVRIEGLAVREAIAHGDLEWEARLVAAHHAMSRTKILDEDGSFSHDWLALHSRFHAELASGCPHPRLRLLRQQLFDASELYRYWSGPGKASSKQVVKEHQALIDAALARDADTAVELLTHHLESTSERLAKRARREGVG
jgi:DNA-binding GntR family transcriptional regulator